MVEDPIDEDLGPSETLRWSSVEPIAERDWQCAGNRIPGRDGLGGPSVEVETGGG